MMSRLMLDTNMVTYVVRQKGNALKAFQTTDPKRLCLSAISYGEVMFGLEKRPNATTLHRLIRTMLVNIEIVPFTSDVADVYGELRARLEDRGISVDDLDLLIAAHALCLDATLVTADKAFTRIDGLRIENWLA